MFGSMLADQPVPSVLAMVMPSTSSRVSEMLPPWIDSDPPVVLMMLVPPMSTLLRLTPGIMKAATWGVRPVGIASSNSWLMTRCRFALWMSTIGDSPVTVTVSSTAPTRITALTVAANDPLSSIPSRRTELKPGRLKVTV